MLTMTAEAATAIRALADRQVASDRAGLRIANAEAGKFTAIMVAGPAPDDQLVESAGARLFVAADAAASVADFALDASTDSTGSVTFALLQA